ncbi:MAG: hypothetical protein Tsb0026_02750 [Sulfuricaulis sp.]
MLERKSLSEITETDLLGLIEDKVSENKTIDYKRDRIGNSDSEKKEFLYDISSFANASGGHLILGAEEEDGLPTRFVGLGNINIDQEMGRLQEIIRDGIRPQILGLAMVPVELTSGGKVLVIRVPKSWNPPHQVVYQKSFRFYGRGVNGKYLLDVDELRRIFGLSDSISDKIKQFRVERLAKIVADETPIALHPGAREIFHAIPLTAIGEGGKVDLNAVLADRARLIQLMDRGGSMRHNLDGLLAYSTSGERADAYAQLYRNGIVEIVWYLEQRESTRRLGDLIIPSEAFEKELIAAWNNTKHLYGALNVMAPVVLMLSFVGIKGWHMGVVPEAGFRQTGFDRDPLLIPEIIVENLELPAATDLRPILDATWNAEGWAGSIYFDNDGKWVGHR